MNSRIAGMEFNVTAVPPSLELMASRKDRSMAARSEGETAAVEGEGEAAKGVKDRRGE